MVRAEDPAAALRGEEDAYPVFRLEAAKRNADPRVFGGVAGHLSRLPTPQRSPAFTLWRESERPNERWSGDAGVLDLPLSS